ncbi:hypothetical protein QZH41_015454, partial [Actinostola sp. cb2023]
MVLTCLQFGFPVVLTCLQFGLPVVLTCLQFGFPVVLTCLQFGFPVVLTCFQFGFPVVLTCLQFWFPVVLTCFQFGFPVVLTCLHFGFPVVLTCLHFGFPVVLTCLQFGFPVVLTCLQFGFPVVLTCLQFGFPVVLTCLQFGFPVVLTCLQFGFPVVLTNSYEKPTPIQAQAIPAVMAGRDMIGIAKTGSGKTLAFLIPMFRHVKDQPPLERDEGPLAIVMTPTRELAIQIHRECKKFCKPLNLRVVCVYGGTGISEQIAELKRGAEIIVCTPGRMIDMLTANNGRVTNCTRCTYLVLDEADRMFDMGFEPQVMRIIDCIRPDRQTVMFSATFPRQMEALARRILDKPVEIQVGGRSVVCSDVDQNVVMIEEENKFLKLLELLGIFQEKGMDQFDRDSTIADFKNGVTKLMIATSVAARGLDIKRLNLVVNYDCPNHYEDYVHRVGRTGRAGNKGTAYTFIAPEQGRLGLEIVKALENSEVLVPADLRTLACEYIESLKAEGKQIVKTSGFSGKGFKFNEEENNKVNEAKKLQKWALGLQDSDDEAEAAEKEVEEIDKRLDAVFSKKPHIKKAAPVANEAQIKGEQKAKLNLAASIAAKINQKISAGTNNLDPTQQAASQIIKGGTVTALTGLDLARQLAEKIHSKLNYEGPQEEPKEQEQKEVETERYEDEVEINEFPQTARWKITSKVFGRHRADTFRDEDTIMAITEYSECAVTVRGTYFTPGKEPKEGERKIYLYIEGPSERAIQLAKVEIKRIVKEELVRL